MPSRTDRIEQAARRHVEAGSHAGIEWLVRLDGHDWLRGSVGLADPLAGTPCSPEGRQKDDGQQVDTQAGQGQSHQQFKQAESPVTVGHATPNFRGSPAVHRRDSARLP